MSADKNIVNLTTKTFSTRDGNTVHQLVANRSIVRTTTTHGNQQFSSRSVEVQTTVSNNRIESNHVDPMKTYFHRTIVNTEPGTLPTPPNPQLRNDLPLSQSKVSAKPTADKKQFAAECLKSHNEYRKMHGAEPLILNETIMKHAQNWAEVCG